VLVLLAGTNDIAGNTGPMTDEEIQNNIASIAELASAQGVRVVLASILPVSNYHVQPGTVPQTERRPPARINALNGWLRDHARTRKYVYLDYFTAMADANGMLKPELSEDDLHPNVKGYAVMTPLAEEAIARALK
jgi:lysophospholipase L1-like esterase